MHIQNQSGMTWIGTDKTKANIYKISWKQSFYIHMTLSDLQEKIYIFHSKIVKSPILKLPHAWDTILCKPKTRTSISCSYLHIIIFFVFPYRNLILLSKYWFTAFPAAEVSELSKLYLGQHSAASASAESWQVWQDSSSTQLINNKGGSIQVGRIQWSNKGWAGP